MDSLSTLNPLSWPTDFSNDPAYLAGNAAGWLSRSEKHAATSYPLAGRLYVAKSGWLLLSVPNALVRGIFDAMTAPGAELPLAGTLNVPNVPGDVLNAHISVMTAEEVASIGANKINERGHHFGYTLGPIREIDVKSVDGVSKVWAVQVASPALATLRKSYGLTPLPKGDHPFHITVAVRRKKVLQDNEVGKFDGASGRGELKAAADNPQPRVRVVMPYKNQYLLETLNNSKWPQNIGKRRFMGGGIENGETPAHAAAREMFEELGVKIKPTAFRSLGNDPREGWQHEHYLELLRHKLKPGNFNASVGSDAVVTLSHGLPEGDDYMGPDIKKLLAPVLKKAADELHGGAADGMPDSKFPQKALAQGAKHEHEHTDDDQIAKEIAKDHLQEDPAYYEKVEEIEKGARSQIIAELLAAKKHSDNKRYGHKTQILRRLMEQSPQDWVIDDSAPKFPGITHAPTKFQFHTDRTAIPSGVKAAGSVYLDQLKNLPFSRNFTYDFNKPVFENIRNHAQQIKQRGDWLLQARRNEQRYRSAIDPHYRHQLAMQAFNGQMPQPAYVDRLIEQYGNNFLGTGR